MSKSLGQTLGGVIGGVVGFIGTGGNFMGAVKGFVIGSSLGGMIDPPPGPDLKGPTLEDKSFNSAAYGVSLATLHGTIAHSGSIIYLENNEYKSVAKKQKTGSKGGGSKGSYTTTTYFATFAVAVAEAMAGSVIRRIWAGGKLIYSVGDGADIESIRQSNANADGWHYYDGTQTEPDSRMEAVLGVGNCPSYEGTAYIIFYDFDLTEYGNGLQGCPIKVEVIADFEAVNDELPLQKVFESVLPYPAYIYNEPLDRMEENFAFFRALSPGGALVMAHWAGGNVTATQYLFNADREEWESAQTGVYSTLIARYRGLTFGSYRHWQEYDLSSGTMPNDYQDGDPSGWAVVGNVKMVFGGRLHVGSFDWEVEDSNGATYGDGNFYVINSNNIIKLSTLGVVLVSRATNEPTGATYYNLWYDDGFLYRADFFGTAIKIWVYDGETLDSVREFSFGHDTFVGTSRALEFAVYGGLIILGWSTLEGASEGGELHYEQWRFKDFNTVQKVSLDSVVGRYMSAAGIAPAMRDLTALETDYVDGYRVAEVGSARGKIGPLQVAYLFDLIEDGYTIKAVKRGGSSIATISLSKLNARGAGESPGVLVQRDRETDSQLPSRYSLTYIDYSREYDTNTQYADYPARSVSERNQQLPIVLSATAAAQLVDVLINLAWTERFVYEFVLPQEYSYLKPSNIITVEISANVFAVMRISNITYTADQRIQISARRAEPAVYQSSAVGISVLPPSENIPVISAADTVMMDLPAVNDATTSYGFGVAMSGSQSWKGGALLRSIDNGQTYDAVQGFGANCTIGRATTALAVGDYFVIDRVNELVVSIVAGDFFAITEAQMMAGQNYCAYGADGRWEIIQYCTVTVNNVSSVTLSSLVRGLFGTEWAGGLHQIGDALVLLDDPDTAFVGADAVALNSPRKFKGVTTGQDAQLATEIDFTYRGTNLKPLSVARVVFYFDAAGLNIELIHRSRFASSQWVTGVAAPVGEGSLAFEMDVMSDDAVIATYAFSGVSFLYSNAQQIADFGDLQSEIEAKVYQMSAAVGRGYVHELIMQESGDPYFGFVVLLLHCEGVNNSTVFIDSSASAHTITSVGDAKITTAQQKFGASAATVDGTVDCLSAPGSANWNFGTLDFTIECWVKITAYPGGGSYATVFGKWDGYQYLFGFNSSGALVVFADGGLRVTSAGVVGLGAWVHVAFCRSSGTLTLFINGVMDANSASYATAIGASTGSVYVGAADSSSSHALNGYFDELRATAGYCRYIDDFTPPTSAFKNG